MQIIFILSAILLCEQFLGSTMASSPSYEFTNYGVFRYAVISEFAILVKNPIELSKKLVADTYADSLNEQNARVTNFLAATISQFQKVDYKEQRGQIEAFLGYIVIFDLVNGVAIGEEEERELVQDLKVAFDKHNINDVVSNLQSKFDQFVVWLTQKIEEKGDTFTTQEKEAVTSFKVLCQRFKAETDFKKKGALSDDIVTYFK